MSLQTRRRFLAGAMAAGCGSLASFPCGETQAAHNYRAIRYTYDKQFNRTQIAILKSAMNKVAARFLEPRIFSNTKQNYLRWYMGANLGFYNSSHFEAWFTRTQLAVLRASGFPAVRIRAQYDARRNANGSYWAGRAAVGTVKTSWLVSGGRYYARRSGNLDFTLNRYLLGNTRVLSRSGADPNYWAGVIAHEMLHNLGHMHPRGVYDRVFIREYQNALQYNGRYSRATYRRSVPVYCPCH